MPDNLELPLVSPATINVVPFDYLRGADQARLDACKNAGKLEPWFYMETTGSEANPVNTAES